MLFHEGVLKGIGVQALGTGIVTRRNRTMPIWMIASNTMAEYPSEVVLELRRPMKMQMKKNERRGRRSMGLN
jgi:hypothetical protein